MLCDFLHASAQAQVQHGIHLALHGCALSRGMDVSACSKVTATRAAQTTARKALRFRRVVQACWTAATVQDALFIATFSALHVTDIKEAPRHIQRYLWETMGFSKDVFHAAFAKAREDDCASWVDALLASETHAAAVLVISLRLLHAITDRGLARCPLLGLMRMFEKMQRAHVRTADACDAMYQLGFLRFPLQQPSAERITKRVQDSRDVTTRLMKRRRTASASAESAPVPAEPAPVPAAAPIPASEPAQ